MNCSRQHWPSYSLSDVLVDLGEFGLQVLQQPVQQLWHSPFLLGKAPLQHIKPAGNQNSSFLVIQNIPPSPAPSRLCLGMCISVSAHQSVLQWAKMGKNCAVKQQYCCSASPKASHPVNSVILKRLLWRTCHCVGKANWKALPLFPSPTRQLAQHPLNTGYPGCMSYSSQPQ